MPSAARISIFWRPYGWRASAGTADQRSPSSASTLDDASRIECSESVPSVSDPDSVPVAGLRERDRGVEPERQQEHAADGGAAFVGEALRGSRRLGVRAIVFVAGHGPLVSGLPSRSRSSTGASFASGSASVLRSPTTTIVRWFGSRYLRATRRTSSLVTAAIFFV